jgi:predicted transcriptional regulator
MKAIDEDTNVDNTDEKNLLRIINLNPIRSIIIGLLIMYPELSFTELSKKMARSKSTIHPHLKALEEAGIILVKREERRGGNPSKYYAYNRESALNSVVNKIDKSKGINEDIAQKIITKEKNKMIVLNDMIQMYINFWTLLEENLVDAPNVLENMPTILADYADTRFFLSREEYELWYEKYFNLSVEFGGYLAEESVKEPLREKPYYFFASFLPLKQIFEKTHFDD